MVRQPCRVGQVHPVLQRRAVPDHPERVVPTLALHEQLEQTRVVAELVVRLARVRDIPPAREVPRARAQGLGVALAERAHHLRQLVLVVRLPEQRDGFVPLLRLHVHLRGGGVVGNLLRPLRLPVRKLPHRAVSRAARAGGVFLRPRLGLVELPQVGEHLHRFLHLARLRERLRGLLEQTLVRQRLPS